MADRIKGITVAINGDVTGLDKALRGVNKEIKSTQGQLKDVERLLKLDPTNTELLAQKQSLLSRQVEQTGKKLEELKRQKESVTADNSKYEEWQRSFSALQTQITKTEKELAALEKTQKSLQAQGMAPDSEDLRTVQQRISETKGKLDQLHEQVNTTYKSLGQPISTEEYERLTREVIETEQAAKAAEDAYKDFSDSLKNAGNDTEKFSEKISTMSSNVSKKANDVAKTFTPVTAAIAGVGAAAIATVPKTEELRSDLSKLDNNARIAGVGVDAAREAFELFAVATDETDSSVEAVSNLLQAGFTESNLQKAVEGLTGAYLAFPDTLKIESLADSLQETLATGKATGQFAELLDRLGIGAENFSDQLNQIGDQAGMQNYILQMFAQQGLTDVYNGWVSNNTEMTRNKEVQLELQQSMAEFAESILPLITVVAQISSAFFNWFNNLSSGSKRAIIAVGLTLAAIAPIAKMIGGISGAVDAVVKIGSIFTSTTGNAVYVTFAKWAIIIAAVAAALAALIAMINILVGKGDQVNGTMRSISSIGKSGSSVGVPSNYSAYSVSDTQDLPQLPYLASGGILSSGSAVVGEAGPELLTMAGGRAVVQPLTATLDSAGLADALKGVGGGEVMVNVNFGGSLAQLGRLLQPHVTAETARRGPSFSGR